MAIVFDAATPRTNTNPAPGSESWSHTATGSNLLLLVAVALNSTSDLVTGVTYNGVALTRLAMAVASGGTRRVYLYALVAPVAGTHTVVVSYSSTPNHFAAAAVTYSGVDQTTPRGTPVTNTGTGFTPTLSVASASGELVVDAVTYANQGNPTLSVGAGQTERVNTKDATVNAATPIGMSEEAGAASVTMSWSLTNSVDWAIIGVALKPATTAVALAAAIGGVGSLSGAMSVARPLTAAVSGAGALSGGLDVARGLNAAIGGAGVVLAQLTVLPAGRAAYALEVDWDDDGDFSDDGEDVTADTMVVETRRGRAQPDWVLSKTEPGKLVATLKNTSGNYSSGAAGVKVRLRTVLPVAAILWTGHLQKIKPITPEPGGLPTAELTAIGPLGKIAKAKVKAAVSSGALTSVHVAAVLDDIGWPSADRAIETGEVTTGYWPISNTTQLGVATFDLPDALAALQDLEDTELGFLWETCDGKIGFQKRTARTTNARSYTAQATFSDHPGATLGYRLIELEDGLDGVFSEVVTQAGAVTLQPLAEIWSYADVPLTLAAGEYLTFTATYPPPKGSSGILVDTWTTPVIGTDIISTGGTLVLDARIKKSANTMQFIIQNTHATDAATITKVAARGTAVIANDVTKQYAVNDANEATYGRRTLDWPAPFFATAADAKAAAALVLERKYRPWKRIRLTITANRSAALLTQCLQRELSDRVDITANDVTGLGLNSAAFWIEAITHRIEEGGTLHTTTFELGQMYSPAVGASSDDEVA